MTRETSTTLSPFSTPSLKSSKNRIFMGSPSESERKVCAERVQDGFGVVLVQRVDGARDLDQRAARQLARHALGDVGVAHGALCAAQQQQRRLDLAQARRAVADDAQATLSAW